MATGGPGCVKTFLRIRPLLRKRASVFTQPRPNADSDDAKFFCYFRLRVVHMATWFQGSTSSDHMAESGDHYRLAFNNQNHERSKLVIDDTAIGAKVLLAWNAKNSNTKNINKGLII